MEVRSETGRLLHTSGEIHSAFTQHYETLYTSVVVAPEQLCDDFLSGVELPCLTADQRNALEEPLDFTEVQAGIQELASVALPDQFFLRVAFSCYRRSLRLVGGGGGGDPIWAGTGVVGQPRGSIVTSGSELRAWDVRNRAAARFLDLGLITAKRLITRRWKSSDPPAERAWKSSFEVWTGTEGVALAREDALGLLKYPLSVRWEAMLACL
ncbi:hypothetical protein NDU88_001219 [Pleurodeles waltl]|uniref:Uncharacterized protein n=1 Tax=Pleurodeles waltl TaxID=8319 RepID=A0AAV7NCU6_PLEWA|nr:hypothetical protein NDU88_001219 [Pleurodeles waltl]